MPLSFILILGGVIALDKQKYEYMRNAKKALVFNKAAASGASGYLDAAIVDHGIVEAIRVRFAAGENGTLHIRPVMILPGNIPVDLLEYAVGGDKYLSGDDETINVPVAFETENHAKIRIFYENTATDPLADDSIVNVIVTVNYFAIVEPNNVIG